MTSSLVGSEMCIRDRSRGGESHANIRGPAVWTYESYGKKQATCRCCISPCLLYTSDAADDM
eukprot:6573533-Prorocentrum_lima.AAC.1